MTSLVVPMSALGDAVSWLGDPSHWQGQNGIPILTYQILKLSFLALVIAAAIALPIALWLGHVGRGGALAINITNVGRAIPIYALMVVLAVGPLGLGQRVTVIALVLFGIPPIVTNTYVGVRGVDRDTVEAARGMGLTAWQVLWRVEVPLAFLLIMTGLRLAAVQILATATLGAYFLAGGLGFLIYDGFSRQDQAELVSGAFLVAALALLVEGLFELLQRRLDPVRRTDRAGGVSVPRV
ncbi:MAG: osmoprotectant transport system permease protein [Actinomycetota bacterium]|nr:osmoprotectant transport system permease protein [Actinomycetota bacterium]